jgi:hypothetical protein
VELFLALNPTRIDIASKEVRKVVGGKYFRFGMWPSFIVVVLLGITLCIDAWPQAYGTTDHFGEACVQCPTTRRIQAVLDRLLSHHSFQSGALHRLDRQRLVNSSLTLVIPQDDPQQRNMQETYPESMRGGDGRFIYQSRDQLDSIVGSEVGGSP